MKNINEFINKVICGDCLEVMKDIPDKSIDCIITDPPYGIDFQSCRKVAKYRRKEKIANDKTPFVIWTDEAYRILKDNSGILCFTRWDTELDFRKSLSNSGFNCKQQIIWDKEVHGMGDLTGDFAPQHENIIFATKGRFTFPSERPTSVFRYKRVNSLDLVHPNEKPLSLMKKLVLSITKESDIVLDIFAGSGSTLIASKQLNRKYIGTELNQKYVDICNQRLSQETLF